MKPLTTNLRSETQKPHADNPWIWLVELVADESTVARTLFRLTEFDEPITFAGKTYYPFPVRISAMETDSEGSLPQVELQVSNVGRDLAYYLHVGQGFIDKQVTLTLVHKAHLASATDKLEQTFVIRGARSDDEWITLRLELFNLNEHKVPFELFARDRCRWVYGSSECGFAITAGSPQSCTKTLADCRSKGDYEVANKRPRLHPRRYGAFPGLPRKVR